MNDSAARSALRSPGTFVAFDRAQCDQPIHRCFEWQAAARPDATAVRLDTAQVSYAQLNRDANRAARALIAAVGRDAKPVALLLDQGIESVVWTLAILKAGRAYAPLDQRLPQPVLRAMVGHLEPGAMVAGASFRHLAANLAQGRIPVVHAALQRGCGPDSTAAATNLDIPVDEGDTAYVFYTSGSTGPPKGVADCHRNVLHNVLRYTNSLRFAPGDTLSLVQNPSFSGTVSTLFGALANGATVAPFDLQGEGLRRLPEWLKCAQVTVFHGVPSIFRQLRDPVDRFPHVRLVRLEGDRCTAADLRHFRTHFQDGCTLVNGLGATECGLVRQYFVEQRIAQADVEPLPIGYAVPDMTVLVVDGEGRPSPVGAIGEIVVDSAFLAAGYWRNAAMTAERFTDVGEGLRRYRTGDLGRMAADGCLTHLGRVNHAVRIGGEFVEVGEIERHLLAVPGILQAMVRDYVDRAGERRLCAYLVAAPGSDLTVDRLRAVLSERVGARIVPTAFVFLDDFPLSKDLKVDPKRLPQPGQERPPLPNAFELPATEPEHALARIWAEVLEVDPVGVTDSFFDLGGDSLRAVQVVTRLRERHGTEVPMAMLFAHPTVRSLATALQQQGSFRARGEPASRASPLSG